MEAIFLVTLLRMVTMLSLIGIRAPLAWQTNGKATSWVTISSIGHKFGNRSDPEKKLHLCGQFGTKLLQSMSGGLVLHQPLLLSNVCFAFPIPVSQSNINYGTASKQGGHGDGPRSLCMNFVG